MSPVSPMAAIRSETWWKSGILYQVYVRSFADSDGDGVGDLPGVIQRLDHLAWLGIDGVWLCPITTSPNADWGYDVADYLAVQPEYGTLEDFDLLVEEAGRRGIRVLLDLVPNHTSSRHPWFEEARASRQAPRREWYVWADPRPDGSPPNNWLSSFGGPAWTLDEATGQMYLHNFAPEQPDLNWWNEAVREAFDGIQRFWLDRGVAGFRIDVCHMVVKDAKLRDNPPVGENAGLVERVLGQHPLYNSNRPEVHDVIRRWRRTADSYDPPRLLLGETVLHNLEDLARFYGNGDDELNLAFNIPFIEADLDSRALRTVVDGTESALPAGAWPVWATSNHDVSRMASRWGNGEAARSRAALMVLLTLRGTPVLYQGDEIGLTDTTLVRQDLRDPVGLKYWPAVHGRDPARTPMPWSGQPGGGFTVDGVKPWLPFGDLAACNVDSQRDDPGSILNLVRDLLELRRRTRDLQEGAYAAVPSPGSIWAWRRGAAVLVVVNLGDAEASLPNSRGIVAICTDRRRDGELVAGHLRLGPWEGLVLFAASPWSNP